MLYCNAANNEIDARRDAHTITLETHSPLLPARR